MFEFKKILLWMTAIWKWSQISFNGNNWGKTKLIWSGFCMSSLSPLHRLATQHFDESYKRRQSESFLSQSEHTIWISRHRTLRTQYLHLGVILWNYYIILASCKDFCKLQSFCLCSPFTTLLFRHLPTEIVIFINVSYQMKCFNGDSFSVF